MGCGIPGGCAELEPCLMPWALSAGVPVRLRDLRLEDVPSPSEPAGSLILS
jgi:hypothetical protein